VTPLSVRKVEPASADVEADGREEPNPVAGKRKGLCCTEGRPAKRLKRVFNRAAQVGPPRYRRECMQCVWRSDEDNSRKSDHSIEDPTVIGKILSHLEATSYAQPSGSATCAVGVRARHRQGFVSSHRSTNARWILHKGKRRVGRWLCVRGWSSAR